MAEDDGQKVATFFAVVDDVLAEQIIVAEHHRGAQGGEMLLHPHHLLLQHHLAGNLLLDSGQGAQRQEKEMRNTLHFLLLDCCKCSTGHTSMGHQALFHRWYQLNSPELDSALARSSEVDLEMKYSVSQRL